MLHCNFLQQAFPTDAPTQQSYLFYFNSSTQSNRNSSWEWHSDVTIFKISRCFVKYSESWLWTIACRTLSRAGLTSRVQPYFQLLYFYLLVFSVVCWDYLCLYQAIRIQVKYLVSVITIRIVFRKQIASIVSLFFWKLHKRMYQYLWFSFVILWDQPFSAFTHKSQLSHSPLTYLQPVFNVSLASYILCSSS